MKKQKFILLFIISITTCNFAQVGIGTDTPDASAVLDITSISKGILIPRLTTAQRDVITNPTFGLLIMNVDSNCINYFTTKFGGSWSEICGKKITTVYCNGPTELVEVVNLVTGEIWMDRNLGASRKAIAYNDVNAYGDLYQWGRFTEGHQCVSSISTTINAITSSPSTGGLWDSKFITENNYPGDWLSLQDNTLWQGVNGVNNPCPMGFRMPTATELNQERLSWLGNDINAAFNSPLKFTPTGYRYHPTGTLSLSGRHGNYWSSTVFGVNSKNLFFGDTDVSQISYHVRASGFSVRCIKD